MAAQDQFRQALEDLNLSMLRRIWSEVMPHLPQPKTDQEALVSAHYARTQALSITLSKRAYSHRWLTERQFPSGLPDELREKAEQICPVVREGVMVAVKSMSSNNEYAAAIEKAMSDAIAEAYADGKTDPEYVRLRMKEARERITHGQYVNDR